MASKKVGNDGSLPFAALQLLAPPVRLVSAALWKVMKQRDVMLYGVVEEFVTSACETVPGLLTVRHQGKLVLGLRGRLILELCREQPDEKVITPHLKRICVPAALSSTSDRPAKRDVKILRTVESFNILVRTLLTNAAQREEFFKEEFLVDYGPQFDQELEKLLWEFLIRLDQMLPVPNLAQTASWLSDTPPVVEECARAATQPQLLKILLQHQACLGHLETAASLPPNMGDSILDSLSLPPSGRMPSNQTTGDTMSGAVPSGDTTTREETPFAIMSRPDVPAMIAAGKRTETCDNAIHENLENTEVEERQKSRGDGKDAKEARNTSKRSSRMKRKHPDKSDSEEELEVHDEVRSGGERTSKRLKNAAGGLRQGGCEQRAKDTVRNEELRREVLEARLTQLGFRSLRLPEDPSLVSVFASCLCSRPRVVLDKLSEASAGASRSGRRGKPSYTARQDGNRKSQFKSSTSKDTRGQSQKPELELPGLDNKENHPELASISNSPAPPQRNTATAPPRHSEEYVPDSEDEATKNFKVRLFRKRYYKTKHGTYVPTLREFFKPRMARPHLLSAGYKKR